MKQSSLCKGDVTPQKKVIKNIFDTKNEKGIVSILPYLAEVA